MLNLLRYSVRTMSPCHTFSGTKVLPSPVYRFLKKPLAYVEGLMLSFIVLSINRFLHDAACLVLGLNLSSGLVNASLLMVDHLGSLIAGCGFIIVCAPYLCVHAVNVSSYLGMVLKFHLNISHYFILTPLLRIDWVCPTSQVRIHAWTLRLWWIQTRC